MQKNIFIPKWVKELAPTVITSPIQRSGTTLLQRLICSSSNSIVYGDNCANEIHMFINYYTVRALLLVQNERSWEDTRKAVMHRDVNGWIPNLMPEMKGYHRQLAKSSFGIVKYCHKYAKSEGKDIWGFKNPGWNGPFLKLLKRFMPKCKIIYIFRDPIECVQSAKATSMVQNIEELEQFCQTWLDNFKSMEGQFNRDEIMMINFEKMINDPSGYVDRISKFTGAEDIDIDVFEHRINTFSNDLEGDPTGKGYIIPAKLTNEETDKIDQITFSFWDHWKDKLD